MKLGKLAAMYKGLNVTGNLDLTDLKLFNLLKNTKKHHSLEFIQEDEKYPVWVMLAEQGGNFNTLGESNFGGHVAMKNFSNSTYAKRSTTAATKLGSKFLA